jgi:hypothetical protein
MHVSRLRDRYLARGMSKGILRHFAVCCGFFGSWRWDVKNERNAVDRLVGQFSHFGVDVGRVPKRVASHTNKDEVKDELPRPSDPRS